MDINRLESSGKLRLISVVLDNVLKLDPNSNGVCWSDLSKTLSGTSSSSRKAYLIDDLEAFELIATSSQSARTFFSQCLRELYDETVSNDIYKQVMLIVFSVSIECASECYSIWSLTFGNINSIQFTE